MFVKPEVQGKGVGSYLLRFLLDVAQSYKGISYLCITVPFFDDYPYPILRKNDFQHPQYNFTWEELNQLMEQAGCEVVEIVGALVFMHPSDPVREELEKSPEIRKKLLTMELQHCTNRSLVNFAGHLLIVGKKR